MKETFEPHFDSVQGVKDFALAELMSRKAFERAGCDMGTFQYLGVLDAEDQPTHVWSAFKRIPVERD